MTLEARNAAAQTALLNTARSMDNFTASQGFYLSGIGSLFQHTGDYCMAYCMAVLDNMVTQGLVKAIGYRAGYRVYAAV